MNKSNWRDIMQREGNRTELERGKYIDESYPKTKTPTQINYKIVSLIAACAVLVIALNILLPTLFNGSHGITPGGDITTKDGYTTQYPDHGTLEPEDENIIILRDGTEIQIPRAMVRESVNIPGGGGYDADGLGYGYFFASEEKTAEVPVVNINDIRSLPSEEFKIIGADAGKFDADSIISPSRDFLDAVASIGEKVYLYYVKSEEKANTEGIYHYVFALVCTDIPSDTSDTPLFIKSSKYTIMLKNGDEVPLPHALCWVFIHGGTDENGAEQILHGDGSGYMFFFSDNAEYDIPIIPIDDIVAVPDVSYQIIDGATTESDYPQAIKTNVTFGELKKYVGDCDDDVIYVYFTYNYTNNEGNERGANDYVFAVSKDGTSAY